MFWILLFLAYLKGSEKIHVSKLFKDAKNGMFMTFIQEDACTLYETFRRGSHESNNGPCLGWRDNLTSSYQVYWKKKFIHQSPIKIPIYCTDNTCIRIRMVRFFVSTANYRILALLRLLDGSNIQKTRILLVFFCILSKYE